MKEPDDDSLNLSFSIELDKDLIAAYLIYSSTLISSILGAFSSML